MNKHHQRRQNSERGRGVASLRIVNPSAAAPVEVLDASGRPMSSSGSGSYVPRIFQDEYGEYDPARATLAAMGGVLLVSIVGIALIARSWKSEPAPVDIGLRIASNCSSYEITNQTLMEKNIAADVKRQAARGPVDPFEVAAAYVRRASSSCSVYPSPPRSGVEVDVFSFVFGLVIDAMAKQNLLTDISKATFQGMLETWNLQVSSSSQDDQEMDGATP